MRRLVLQLGAVVAMLICAVAVCRAQPGPESLYTANCAMCHGKTGLGDRPRGEILKVKPFTDPTVLQITDSAMHDIVTNGKGQMKGYAKRLSNDQVTSLIEYIHQLQGK